MLVAPALMVNQAKLTVKLCVVSVDERLNGELDMATVFFREVFGTELAPRVMSGIIALSIFGNIVVMTFTASRGKLTQRPSNRLLEFLYRG